jgi:hypothetical protein
MHLTSQKVVAHVLERASATPNYSQISDRYHTRYVLYRYWIYATNPPSTADAQQSGCESSSRNAKTCVYIGKDARLVALITCQHYTIWQNQ